jgi:preprotein translocase subunit SecY
MFRTIRNAWKIADLRQKLLYTLMIIVIFRIGSAITVPFLDPEALKAVMNSAQNGVVGYLDVLTGGAFTKATIFSLSVTPYINASIVMQLLSFAIPALQRLMKEGEAGRKKVAQITRYLTVALGLVQAIVFYLYLYRNGVVSATSGIEGIWAAVVIVTVFVAGTTLVMWLGEQINDKGVGNGISILLFAGILSRGPSVAYAIVSYWGLGGKYYALVPVIVVLALAVVASIVLMNNAERRIPVQYAKRVVGRKMYGGQSTYVPIKITMSGVMPIIFASSIVGIPSIVATYLNQNSLIYKILDFFSYKSAVYAVLYFSLIIFFNYFYVSMQYNPHEISNNLKKNNGGIPGIRPGKPTSDFIQRTLGRITFIGAIFLGIIAIFPILIAAGANINIALGGTTILIVVGVALDTTRQIESLMMMRHYKGFLG